jgi:hypothetical protein
MPRRHALAEAFRAYIAEGRDAEDRKAGCSGPAADTTPRCYPSSN